MKFKVAVVTGSRADYGLLKPLIQTLKQDADFETMLIVTGMHLSEKFGSTFKEIENDGLEITNLIDMAINQDSPHEIISSMGQGLSKFGYAFKRLKPDLIIVLGDRFELLSIVSAAVMSRIPIAHIHGGEATEGLIDDAIRHAVTKMSSLHFPVTDLYKNRIIQMGEQPNRVFNVGAPVLDTLDSIKLLSKKELINSLNLKNSDLIFSVTYHPITLEKGKSALEFSEVLKVLDVYPTATILFSQPNADMEGREIEKLIIEYISKNKERCQLKSSLGQLRYLSLLKHADLVIGNSSSGLLEAPHFKTPTINIGDRQKGRLAPKSVIHCQGKYEELLSSIKTGLSPAFLNTLIDMDNPYGDGTSAVQTVKIIKSKLRSGNLLRKPFYEVKRS
ncbi:MAG: UDP-N-acetylglucosamine 2-epimerase (hydrolyzing) [Methylocystaceae bacterium]|nr:UDP-N-acetylglucosamine 2-epimerase (hydrolyzing) [Methylocystaceae bacterium]